MPTSALQAAQAQKRLRKCLAGVLCPESAVSAIIAGRSHRLPHEGVMADPSEGGTTSQEPWGTRAPGTPDQPPTSPEPIPETITAPTQLTGFVPPVLPENAPHVPGYQILGELGRGGMG